MTQEESIDFGKNLPDAEILISHDGPYHEECKNQSHAGLKGILNYQNRTGCYIIRGHIHDRYKTDEEQCCYKIEKIVL